MEFLKEVTYKIFKDDRYTGRNVTLIKNYKKFDEAYLRLVRDYPVSEGYLLLKVDTHVHPIED